MHKPFYVGMFVRRLFEIELTDRNITGDRVEYKKSRLTFNLELYHNCLLHLAFFLQVLINNVAFRLISLTNEMHGLLLLGFTIFVVFLHAKHDDSLLINICGTMA